MILVKDRTGSKNGTADSTLVVPDRKVADPAHFSAGVPAVVRISGGRQDTGGKDAERLYQRLQSCSQAGLRDAGMRVSGLYDAVFIVGI